MMASSAPAVVLLKPAEEWSEKEVAQAPYDLQQLTGPRLTGNALVAFRMACEFFLTKEILYFVYMAKNRLPQLLSGTYIPEAPKASGVPDAPLRPEAGVVPVADDASPSARVKAALASLGVRPEQYRPAPGGGGKGKGAAKASARPTILDYHAAYLAGDVTPADVAEALLGFLEREPRSAAWLCEYHPDHVRAQAAASTARYAAGAPLSVLDGVPYAVKDAVNVLGHTNGSGTCFLGEERGPVPDVALEAPSIAALRSLGAVMVGKTQMQEFGLLPTGLCPKLGVMRNPHGPNNVAGGSSGGSGCVVASGLVAFAIGTDGGGSVRIPASLCGIVGFKPTQGRMASEPEGSSLVTLGPMTTTVADALIVYAAMACPGSCYKSPLSAPAGRRATGGRWASESGGPSLSSTRAQAQAEVEAAIAAAEAAAASPPPEAQLGENAAARPPLALPARALPEGVALYGGVKLSGATAAARPLAGVRIGVFWPWFEDAQCCVVAACRKALDALARLGAQVVSVVLPELDHVRVGHLVMFLSECYALNRKCMVTPSQHAQLHEDSRVIMSVASKFTSADYLQALRVRRRQADHWRRAFQSCDFIAVPGTACVAPEMPPGAEICGMLDLTMTGQLVRFTQQANLVGLPALVLPAGTAPAPECAACPAPASPGAPAGAAASHQLPGASAASHQLPIGFQLVGQPWHDAALLRVGCLLEEALRGEGCPPPLPPVLANNLAAAAKPTSPTKGKGRRAK